MSPLPVRMLRRRPLLSAAAIVAVGAPLTGCEDVPLDPSADDPAAQGTSDADPDAALLDETVRAEAEVLSLLQAVLRTAPARQRQVAQQAIAVHEAHLRRLDESPAAAGGPARRPTPTWRVVPAEEDLARRHAAAAVRASSGQFARVLAGMAAASAQQAEVWRRTAGSTS